jgi:hypothetical protein
MSINLQAEVAASLNPPRAANQKKIKPFAFWDNQWFWSAGLRPGAAS